MKNKPDYYNDLDNIYLKIWSLLENGLKDRSAPFHIPVFICGQNNEFDGRIVVLKGIDKEKSKIWIHTDIRSNKIKILKNNPKATLLFYDKDQKIQLRISTLTKISYQNSITSNSWKKTGHMSRLCYLGKDSPGKISTVPTSGLSEQVDNSKYTLEESEIGYKNFCVVENFISSIEWLYLAAKGHRRAYFIVNSNQKIESFWKIP